MERKELNFFFKLNSAACILPDANWQIDRKIVIYKLRCVASIVILTFLHAFATYAKISLSLIEDYIFSASMRTMEWYVNVVTIYSSAFRNYYNLRLLLDNFELIDDVLISGYLISPPRFKRVSLKLGCIVLLHILLGIYNLFIWSAVAEMANIFTVMSNCCQQVLIALSTFTQYHFMKFIESRYAILRCVLDRVARGNLAKSDSEARAVVDNVIFLRRKICDGICLFNEIFGWMIFVKMLLFLMVLMNSLNGYLHRVRNWKNLVYLLILAINAFVQMMALNYCGESINREASNFRSQVQRLSEKTSENYKLAKRVEILSQQIQARNPQISASGFFVLNNASLFTLVNLMATYFIAIYQLK